jgi:GT2 family glycosyltransferase
MPASPRVSVVVITRDRAGEALRAVSELRALPEEPPVVVVDNGSTDGTVPLLASLSPGVQVLEAGCNLGSAGRNLGAGHTHTPYIAFSDDDSWWAPGALDRAADLLDHHPAVGLLMARVLVGAEKREDPICACLAASPLPRREGLPWPTLLGFMACGTVVRREAFSEVGGFELRLGVGGEEELLAIDLASRGWQIVYVADVVAHHHPSSQRNPGRRSAQLVRNALWVAWLRRPARSALAATWRLGRAAIRDRDGRAGLRAALAGIPWVASRRRVVPAELEGLLQLLDDGAR